MDENRQPAINIIEVLRLAFTGQAVWLSGQDLALKAVNWVVTDPEEVQPGDICLLPAGRLNRALLDAAQRRGAAAVVCLGPVGGDHPRFPDQLAVLTVPNQTDLRRAQRLLATTLVNQRAVLMERSVRIYAMLSQLAAQGEGLDGLVKAMAEISGRGVMVQDKRGQVLADCPSSTLNAIWEDILALCGTLESLPESLHDRKQVARSPHPVSLDLPGGVERLVHPIIVSQVARGYLSLIGLSGEMDALDHVVIEQGSLACALEMSRDKAVRETEKRLKGELLTALLHEDLSPRDARLWAQSMGLDLSQQHAALRFAWDGSAPPSRRRMETLINECVTRLKQVVIVSSMGPEVVCFCQLSIGDRRPEAALQLGQAVLDQSRSEFPDSPLRCGVGTAVPDVSAWRDSFRQAGQALQMARRLGADAALFFPDLTVYRLLMQMEHNPELTAFLEETIGPLIAYEGGAELLRTLESYFEHNGNVSQTAEALFIHRNTLLYRLERITEITEIDLDRPESRLALQLGLSVYRMLGRHNKNSAS